MKQLNNYICEKLRISSKSNVNERSPELESIWNHFEIDDLYEIDYGRLQTEPYITTEDGEELMSKLNDFLIENDADKNNFKYFILKGHKFKSNKIAKDFKKHTPTVSYLNSSLHFAKDNKTIFEKGSLYFEVSSELGLIGMYGPLGGSKLCQIKQ